MAASRSKGSRIKAFFLNKYSIVLIGFAVFVVFFDQHNLIHRAQNYQRNKEMEKELKFYKDEILMTKQKMHELQSNSVNLEKFAREQYLMKNKDEEVFIIKE